MLSPEALGMGLEGTFDRPDDGIFDDDELWP
jgi:hypothetical protein